MIFSNIRLFHANNLATLRRSPLTEISGSFGDLGTLLPLMIALAANNSISLSTTLIFCGLWNVVNGVIFGIPLPVQPMKAIAAVAISRSFGIAETVSAGFFVSGVILIFSATGLLRWFTRLIPIPVVKGIQVGAGLSLVISTGSSLLQPLGWTSPNWADNLLWALFAFLTLLFTQQFPRFPYALVVFTLGVVLSICLTRFTNLPSLRDWHLQVIIPSWTSFVRGTLEAGLGQVPLTTFNSIIAVSFLSSDLLPQIPAPTATALGISIGFMNLIGGWFGAMPVCHGSGGLAAQYRFGARSGASIIILGLLKIIFGLVFGESLVVLLYQYPKSLLGVMVLAAGLELAKVGGSLNHYARDLLEDPAVGDTLERSKIQRSLTDNERIQRWTIMLMTVGGILAFKNDAVGFVVGMLCHWSYQSSYLLARWERRKWSLGFIRSKWSRQATAMGEEEPLLLNT